MFNKAAETESFVVVMEALNVKARNSWTKAFHRRKATSTTWSYELIPTKSSFADYQIVAVAHVTDMPSREVRKMEKRFKMQKIANGIYMIGIEFPERLNLKV